jgi:PAS domain-containing protein
MKLLAGSHIFVGSICLAISLLHLAIFVRRTELKVHLIFSIMALCCAIATGLDIGMHQARDVTDFALFMKSSNTFQALLWIAFMWFIRFYTGNDRRWAVYLVSGLYSLALLLNLAFSHGILFDHIERLDIVSLPWGERIAFAIGPANPWRLLPDIAWFLLLTYALDSIIRMGRQGQLRRAIFFGVSLFICLGIGYLHGTLIDLGLLPPPSVWIFTFLTLIILMSNDILNQVVQIPVLKRQLASQEIKAQQDLADEKERMGVILASLNTFLVLLDAELIVVWANELTRKAFPRDDLVGEKCYLLAENRSEPCKGCGAVAAFADGRVHEIERLNSINNRWYHIVSMPIKDESGRVVNVLESSTDITERKQTEAARDSAMQELELLKAKLEEENVYLRSEIDDVRFSSKIIGKSNALLYVLSRLSEVAETDSTVLIQGETGVGKELMARAVHDSSNRAKKPFIKVNCAALPQNLVESELFGHEKGAFTGAEQLRRGRFELADGGTLSRHDGSHAGQGAGLYR